MLVDGDRFAQDGWAKSPASPTPLAPTVFLQMTDSFARPFPVQFFPQFQIAPPNVFFYQTSTDRAGSWAFYWGIPGDPAGPQTLFSVSGINWAPSVHEAFGEVHNFTGDQLPGDTGAHVTFRDIAWSDGTFWFGSSFGPTTYVAGSPDPVTNPDRTSDALSFTDGSNFDIWDVRC